MKAEEAIERAADTASRQPRFKQDDKGFFGSVLRFCKRAELEQPDYRSDSQKRDRWLREHWLLEPYWASVVKTCTLLDANRPWSVTGGRNQVYRYTRILTGADDGRGWRHYAAFQAEAFRTADMCSVTELGRDGRSGPLRGIYTVDPARCKLTGSLSAPLQYTPPSAGAQQWGPGDFFRVVSMPNTDEAFHGLGLCATSIAFELIRLLYGVLQHDQEKVGARMPEGLMMLKGISQPQWEQALASREQELDSKLRYRYGGLIVLASGGDQLPEASFVALSTLPPNFDRATFLDQTMYGYAVIVGYDPSEFWPVQTGSIGRGAEPEIQHRKATKKGGAEFALGLQERLQQEMPDTVLYEFEQRDIEGLLQEAAVAQAWADVADKIQWGSGQSERISNEQYLQFLVDRGILPPEATALDEDVEATDTDQQRWRERTMASPDLRRAVLRFPAEPIVRMRWTPALGVRETVLFARADEALGPAVWRGHRLRADDSAVLYDEGGVTITREDVERAVADAGKRVPGEGTRDDPGMRALLLAEPEEEARGFLGRLRRAWTERGSDGRGDDRATS